jgi:nucleobase:cation symporter-1, NCS1 family
MTSVQQRLEHLPEWDVEPVQSRHRVLSAIDLAILWGDLGIGLLVLVTGALLTPALGFPTALAAILLGSLVGAALLALGGVAGADQGVPTMVLYRPVLGLRGSWLPSALNGLQLVGWTAVELWAMSFVADLVARRVFGISARPLWLLTVAAICMALSLWGPVEVVRTWMRKFGAWVIVAISLAVTVMVLAAPETRAALGAPGAGGFPTFGAALDLVIAMPISWLPLVADYNRFARRPRGAFLGTFGGYLVANVWLYALGALLVLGQGAEPSPAGVATGILALAGGSLAGIVFLVALLVGETDEAFADIYSGAMSLRNILPTASHTAMTVSITAVATVMAAWLTMERYEIFLFLIGSVFLPLFGILAADYFVLRRRRIASAELFREGGEYWYSRGIRVGAFVPWIGGFVTYHWIAPLGPGWWVQAWSAVLGSPLSARLEWLNASIPSLAVAFTLTLLFGSRTKRP